MKAKVFVDIYSWIEATGRTSHVPITGIYRHAHALAKEYIPVCVVNEKEDTPLFRESVQRLKIFIVKEIKVFKSVSGILSEYPNIWLSIALDGCAPVLPELENKVYRVAILHDLMSLAGVFGKANVETFHFGARHNDMLLPVSAASWKAYHALALPYNHINEKCDYGCFHTFASLPVRRCPLVSNSISVGTVYPYKRFLYAALVAESCKYTHRHYGAFCESENNDLWQRQTSKGALTYMGFQRDSVIRAAMADSFVLFMLSSEEGFSMTPLEGILLGVPCVVLSKIPAHKEVYSGVGVTWVNDFTRTEFNLVTDGQRQSLFHRWSFDSVMSSFRKLIQ